MYYKWKYSEQRLSDKKNCEENPIRFMTDIAFKLTDLVFEHVRHNVVFQLLSLGNDTRSTNPFQSYKKRRKLEKLVQNRPK